MKGLMISVNGEKLKSIRLDRNFSKNYLSIESGVSRPTINKLENGGGEAREHTLTKLANVLGCKMEDLKEE